LRAENFNFTPINLNFNGIEVKNDTIVAYGDFGSILISYDNAANWNQIRVFSHGTIVKIFLEEDKIIAFNDFGNISVSMDKGKTWHLKENLNDSILCVIRYPDGYFLRMSKKLLIMTNEIKLGKEFLLKSLPLIASNNFLYKYNYSLTFFKNHLIAEIDSIRFLRFDNKLNPIDTISFNNLGLCSNCEGRYQIFADHNYFYTKVNQSVYRSNDITSFERMYESKFVFNYKLINNKIFIIQNDGIYFPEQPNLPFKLLQVISPDSTRIISTFFNRFVTWNLRLKDWTIENNQIFLTGDMKLIAINNLSDSVLNLVSDFSGGSSFSCPDELNDSTFLFYYGFSWGAYLNPIYITKNNGIILKPSVDKRINPNFDKNNSIQFKYFDEKEKILYLGGSIAYNSKGGIFISNDSAKSFTYKSMPDFYFYFLWMEPYLNKLSNLPNIQKYNDNFLTATSIQRYSFIYTFNKKFDLISKYIDSAKIFIDYVNSTDTNSFLIHCLNLSDTTREIKYTNDKGMTWKIIKKYGTQDSILYNKEIVVDNKKYLVFFYFSYKDSLVSLDVLDVEKRTITKIYDYKINIINRITVINNGICSDSNIIYIAIQDTLFYTDDLFVKKKWKYFNFPNSGKIIKTFSKFGGQFFARYSDDLNPDNIFWFTLTDTAKPAPKPIILTDDLDFGKKDIKSSDSLSKKIKIYNQSKETDLKIFGYTLPDTNIFNCKLPKIDSLNSLTIPKNSFYEFSILFIPKLKQLYSDSLIFFSDALETKNISYIKGEGIDTTTDVKVIDEINLSYFYSYPPFPIPAKNVTRSLIFWDSSSDIDLDDISVYNVYGVKICGREKISIEKSNFYSGHLILDCTSFENGIYLIKIQHGTTSKIIKVLVAK